MGKITALILCVSIFLLVQILTWFQLNGQFVWPWFKNNVFLLCLFGLPISYLYIEATRFGFIAFEGLIWPGRLLGFAAGIFTFAICSSIFLGEGLTTKTTISLLLASVLVCIQVFWK
tara:strand:- start:401 stop:751 length:351 start_codon:yes stop_codon:yes gene_type:complete